MRYQHKGKALIRLGINFHKFDQIINHDDF
jgi:hypothetical protein